MLSICSITSDFPIEFLAIIWLFYNFQLPKKSKLIYKKLKKYRMEQVQLQELLKEVKETSL